MSQTTFDVAVLGAGVIGASIGYHLGRLGLRVGLFDRAEPAAEPSASWGSAGGLRQQGRDQREWPLTLEAGRRWPNLTAELEGDLGFRGGGHLHVVENEYDLPELTRRIKRDQAAGINCVALEGAQLRELVPSLTPCAIAASFTPDDGQANPVLTTRAFVAAARRHGATLHLGARGVRIAVVGERAEGLRIADERVWADHVVLAAGAWSRQLASDVGLELAVRPQALQMLISTPAAQTLQPTVTASGRTLSLKQLPSGEYLMGGAWPGDVDPERMTYRVRPENVDASWATAVAVLPAVADSRLACSWCGIEAQSIDLVPLVGPAANVERLYIATGFSGHGFQLAPAVGRAVADALVGAETPELDDLSPSRTLGLDPVVLASFKTDRSVTRPG